MKIFNLLRVHQWVKNLFVFLPAFFSGRLLEVSFFTESLIAFFLFSFTASIIYIINDYKDIEKDKLHPVKKHRPLASGAISKQLALLLLIPFAAFVVIGAFYFLSIQAILVLVAYFLMNLAYTFYLKNIPIVDVTIIALGFVFRVLFGGFVAVILVSKWALLLTFSLALILALGKRRGELVLMPTNTRKALQGYTVEFLNIALTIAISITLVSYIMYSVSAEVIKNFGSDYLYVTTLFVLMGLLRYLQQSVVFNKTESPTKFLYKDHFVQLMVFLWIVSFFVIIYFK
ncbi:UbiA prenyltransferase family protein [Marinirhabdus gelatinilytica]|uniref:UbiA prenyltransferase family protein n=2 Tax=Marinirhabdus gelatinilytica TaxID=1703343 RepID=A0A370QKB7_9FLAO|nr:UbiA prenyltransferase family protein [Marinirhabdus gelatinilytica]